MKKKATEKPKGKKKKKVLKIVLIGLLGILAVSAVGIYGAVGYYYQDRFYSGTIINGVDCSEKSVAYIKSMVKQEAESYSLTIQERGGTQDVIQSADIQVSYNDDGSIDQIMEEQTTGFIFPLLH